MGSCSGRERLAVLTLQLRSLTPSIRYFSSLRGFHSPSNPGFSNVFNFRACVCRDTAPSMHCVSPSLSQALGIKQLCSASKFLDSLISQSAVARHAGVVLIKVIRTIF